MYTYVGDIVVSVNPFKNTGCYGKAIRAKFKGGVRRNLPPHIYALVEHAYGEMNRNQFSQSILISGESGAGKTEAMKIALSYIGEVRARLRQPPRLTGPPPKPHYQPARRSGGRCLPRRASESRTRRAARLVA